MKKTRYLAVTGIMLALTLALSSLETLFSAALPPGVRIGLANIVIMLALLSMGKGQALSLVLLKSMFIFLTKGLTAFVLSLCGGLFSFLIILLLLRSKKNSLMLISVCGALAHNLAQLVVSAFLTGSVYTLYYAPLLIIAGAIAGCATGAVIKITLPAAMKALGKNG